ncbi:MAG: fasciclin domain-containing protein, partial [Paracoccaceae bacterium]|nr:fasciclin domain-containing protein [Paracoccaceae bacterium]
ATTAFANPMVGGAPMYANKNIIQNAVNSKDHTTLVAAVKAAGLVQTLEGKGPFTVFAPTNEAFAKLPKGTVESLLKPENKAKLVKILTYHVVPGKVMSTDLKDGMMAKTVEGGALTIHTKPAVTVNHAHVVKADIEASNGVIHVIDTVLLPKM